MLMDILPSAGRWDAEVYPKVLVSDGLTFQDRNDQRFSLCANSSVDLNFSVDKAGDAEGAPDTRSPPTAMSPFNPVRRRCRRKWVNEPGFAYVRVQNSAVNLRQFAKYLLDLGNRLF